MADAIRYNGYAFSPLSQIAISAEMVEDDAHRTIIYHRYKLRVTTTIVAEPGDSYVGQHFRRIRQLLSKQGQMLEIEHDGFGPRLVINGGSSSFTRDVCFGPKPRMIAWDPIGATNAVEVIWECEFCLPTCDGLGGVRYVGLSQLNYAISYRIDKFGYTTRTVSGYLEIAMSRVGLTIPDTADAYRELIVIPKPINYERESTWQLSMDKRRADFTITDSEVRSVNAYPTGVINIRANHRVGWNRHHAAILGNSISATIELAHNVPRGRAWDIFKAIVEKRVSYATADTGNAVMLESLDCDEELYGHAISFYLTYRIIAPYSLANSQFFSATGLMTTLTDWYQWQAWHDSLLGIQSHRGVSQLKHSPTEDHIVDLCTDTINPEVPQPYYVQAPPPTIPYRLCNDKPPPDRSYVRFEASLTSIESTPATQQITIGGDDMVPIDFDPSDPTDGNGYTNAGKNIERYIEQAPAGLEFEWIGYAERLGYDIPKPGRLKFGNVTLVRKGKAHFRKKFMGMFFCQPLYAAAWNMRYVVDRRPPRVSAHEADPNNTPISVAPVP